MSKFEQKDKQELAENISNLAVHTGLRIRSTNRFEDYSNKPVEEYDMREQVLWLHNADGYTVGLVIDFEFGQWFVSQDGTDPLGGVKKFGSTLDTAIDMIFLVRLLLKP